VVSEGGAGALDAVHQPDQALHGRHNLLLAFPNSPVFQYGWGCSVALRGEEEEKEPRTTDWKKKKVRRNRESAGKKENPPAKEAKDDDDLQYSQDDTAAL
jgi:hypothetical protein